MATVVALPTACFFFDPGVLRDGAWGPALLSPVQSGVYACFILAIGSFLLSWFFDRASSTVRAFVGTGQLCGSIVACLVTLRILPHVVTLAFTVVALVGLLPLATAFSLFRRGIRDLRLATGRGRALGMALGVLAGLVMPLAVGAAGRETNVDRRVQLILQNASHDEKLPLRIFVPEGPWQHVYVFGGYTSEKRINETLGFTWASHIAKTQEMNEASILIVFVRNGRVIKHLRVPIATGFVCVSQSSIWRLKNGKC